MKKQVFILIGIAVVVIGLGTVLFLKGNGAAPAEVGKPVDGSKLIRDNSQMTGKVNAKVTLVEFADFQCPACAAIHPLLKQVLEKYKDNPDFNFVFRNFPLRTIHANAGISAEAAEAAGEQGKFWEMHDAIYENQAAWSTLPDPISNFVLYATSINGLDVEKFKTSLTSHKFLSIVKADEQDGNDLGVNSTPTFYINGEKLSGFSKLEDFTSKIDEALSK